MHRRLIPDSTLARCLMRCLPVYLLIAQGAASLGSDTLAGSVTYESHEKMPSDGTISAPTLDSTPVPPAHVLHCCDVAGVAVGSHGMSCSRLIDSPAACIYSHNYDDHDFTSSIMCCACGGGTGAGGSKEQVATTQLLDKVQSGLVAMRRLEDCEVSTVQLQIQDRAYQVNWKILRAGEIHCEGASYSDDGVYDIACCLSAGVPYTLQCENSYGDGWHGGYLTINGDQVCNDFVDGHTMTVELLGGSLVPCDVTDGSAPSSVYPCRCGNAMCRSSTPQHQCNSETSTCIGACVTPAYNGDEE